MPEGQIKATYIHHCGTDLTVANAARVSFGKTSSLEEDAHGVWHMNDKDVRLINYLAKHEHLSPFGHCFFTFHIKAPVFVRAQLVKHEYLRMNEISRRYVDDEPEFYSPSIWRGRAKDKKQGSSGSVDLSRHYAHDGEHISVQQKKGHVPKGSHILPDYSVLDNLDDEQYGTLGLYRSLLKAGVAPEMARMVLPQSMMTEWYWSGSLDAFFNMCRLRLKPDAQYESRLVALQVSEAISEACPVSWKALMEHIK